MNKILLLSPPYLPEYMRNARCDFVSLSRTQWYPVWLGYAGAFLESKGYTIKLIDAPAYGLDHEAAEEAIIEFRPDLLVVYTGRLSEANDIAFADRIISKLNIDGVFVGPYLSMDPENMLRQARFVSKAVKGEFEYPLWEIAGGRSQKEIKNLVYRDGATIYSNPQRPLLTQTQLDQIPFVTEFFSRHLDYRFYKTPSEYYPYTDIMTGRGCAWGVCTYCLWVHTFITGRVYNTRSTQNVVDEFAFVERSLPYVRSIMIQDDTLTEERARELSEGLLRANAKIPWSCYARGDLSLEVMKLMKKAGCRNLHVGYESGSDEILKRIKKGITRDKMTLFTRDAKRAGLRIHADFAIGFPGETRETANETIRWACELRPHTAQFQLMIPFHGTPFYEELSRNGWLKCGAPDYPGLSKEEMELITRRAYKKFYFSLPFIVQVIKNPHDMLFVKLGMYWRAIQYLSGKKYVR